MKKNQILQLLLLLQLIVVVVVGLSFWDRTRANIAGNTVQQTACGSNSCNTCATCQTQDVCPTCQTQTQAVCPTCSVIPQIGYNQSEMQTAVNNAVDDAVSEAVSGAMSGAVTNVVDDAVNNAVNNAVTKAVEAKLDSTVKTAVENVTEAVVDSKVGVAVDYAVQSALDNAVKSAVDIAFKEAEGRFLSNATLNPDYNVGEAQLQNSRAYDPNSPEVQAGTQPELTVPVATTESEAVNEEAALAEFDSVPDAVKALAAEQSDDFDALASRTSNFKSTDTSFETSNDLLFDGSALKFQPKTSDDVLAMFRGGAVDDDGVFIFKRFGEDHTILAVNSPPSTAPFYGKESTVALVRGDEPNVEVVDFYNQDYPEAGVRQAGIRVIKEVGPDVTKSEWLPFAIDFAAHDTQTKETTEFEVLKITPPSPQANVQVNGYLQIDVVNEPGAPPIEDCNAIEEHGRMKVDAREGISLLYICTSDGWVAK